MFNFYFSNNFFLSIYFLFLFSKKLSLANWLIMVFFFLSIFFSCNIHEKDFFCHAHSATNWKILSLTYFTWIYFFLLNSHNIERIITFSLLFTFFLINSSPFVWVYQVEWKKRENFKHVSCVHMHVYIVIYTAIIFLFK